MVWDTAYWRPATKLQTTLCGSGSFFVWKILSYNMAQPQKPATFIIYYLNHEQVYFIRYKTRGDNLVFYIW